jgi:hypothetical protein
MFYYLVTGGRPLRFCSDCGQAYRERQSAGAALLLERNGGAIPPTLRDDEAALFAHRIGRRAQESTWCPAGDLPAPGAALALLRSLLSPKPGDRPQHAVAISRMIADIRDGMRGPPQMQRAPGRQAIWSFA